ncbi:MAG TPA: tetratricopeptide repeat protein [Verrucomicrobiae bacterium]|nr:tetratricopeptide repeat protein [Verrucomicrobiae bacterium]
MTAAPPAPDGSLRWLRDLWERDWLKGVLLVAAIFFVYQPVWHAGFIWDDDAHVTRPELRSLDGLARIWIQLGATHQYYPLVHSVFWGEHRLWGDWPVGYHLVNIGLHAFLALLLVKVLRQLKISGVWLAAAIFALHPVQVESVAWVSELKNTLSGVFYLGAALVYLGFDRDRRRGSYALALGLFLLGLMSKTVIATLPAVLLVIFWWQRGKLSWRRDVVPLIPFFVAGVVAGLFTAWVERKFGGAQGSEYDFSVVERVLIAGRAIWFYLGKLFWPANLIFVYPRWQVSGAAWWQYLFPATAVLLPGALLWLQRQMRGPLATLLFFVITLFPALGFFNVYPFRFSFVADHFQYLASIGPIVLAAVGISTGFNRFGKWRSFLVPGLGGILLAVLSLLTWRQCRTYTDPETIWRTVIVRNPGCWMAQNNLGLTLAGQGHLDGAIQHYEQAIQLKPDFTDALNNLGISLVLQGKLDAAAAWFQKAVQSHPDDPEIRDNLGVVLVKAYHDYANALVRAGRSDEAIVQFRKLLELCPDFADARHELAVILLQKGQVDEAIAQFQQIQEQYPDNATAYFDLGNACLQKGQVDEAMAYYQRALKIKPDDASACNNLGMAFLAKGMVDESVVQFRRALTIQPDFALARTNLNKALLQKEHP